MIRIRLFLSRLFFYAAIGAALAGIAALFGADFLPVWAVATLVLFVPGLRRELRWAKAMDRVKREDEHLAALPSRTVTMPNGVRVIFTKDGDHVTWKFEGLVGEPHFLLHGFAQDRLAKEQLAAGETPWFPDAVERLARERTETDATSQDDLT